MSRTGLWLPFIWKAAASWTGRILRRLVGSPPPPPAPLTPIQYGCRRDVRTGSAVRQRALGALHAAVARACADDVNAAALAEEEARVPPTHNGASSPQDVLAHGA